MGKKEYMDLSVHEIKNMISAVSGYSELISQGIVTGERALEMAGKIKLMSDVMTSYIDKKYIYELLKSGLYQPEFEQIRICEELEKAKNDVLAKDSSGKEIILPCDYKTTLFADRLLLKELLHAVLENAVKYSEGSFIFTEIEQRDDTTVFKVFHPAQDIPEEELAKLTLPYFRVDKNKSRKLGGQGFGLSIVLEIMLLHKGHMEIISKDNSFTIMLYFKEK